MIKKERDLSAIKVKPPKTIAKSTLASSVVSDEVKVDRRLSKMMKNYKDINDFIIKDLSFFSKNYDIFLPQYKFIYDDVGHCLVDAVFDVGAHEAISRFVERKTGKAIKISHKNKGEKTQKIEISDEAMEVLKRVYYKDYSVVEICVKK